MLIFLWLIPAAAIAGFLAGLFGIGGGIILVPTLTLLFSHFGASHAVMHNAVATSLALIIPSAAMATHTHHKQDALDSRLLKWWIPLLCLGIIIGAGISHYVTTSALTLFFALFLYVAIFFHLKNKPQTVTTTQTTPIKLWPKLITVLIGASSTLLGIGGGIFTTSTLRAFRIPIKNAIAISTVSSLIVGIGGACLNIYLGWHASGRAMYSLGYVNIAAFVAMTPILMLLAPLGAKLAHRLPDQVLSRLFLILLIIMALIMTYRVWM